MYCRDNTSLKDPNKLPSNSEPKTKIKKYKPSSIIKLVEIEYLSNDINFSNFTGTYFPRGLDITFFIFNNKIFIRKEEISLTRNVPSIKIKLKGLDSSSVSSSNPFLTDLKAQDHEQIQ